MMTIKKVSEMTGVTVRTLQYYDKIGLLSPAGYTEAGYRLYDDTALEQLQQILLFRELEFPLKDIISIMNSPGYDREKALTQQIELLELKKQHLEKLIGFAQGIKMLGVKAVDFSVFNTDKLNEYTRRAKEMWGDSEQFREFEQHDSSRTDLDKQELARKCMKLFAEFGKMKNMAPGSDEVQAQVRKLQDFFTANFYNCTNDILLGLGQMYSAGGEFTENIDSVGGSGTASFAAEAIRIFCNR